MFLAYLWEFTVHEYSICMSHLDSGLYFWVPCPTCVPGGHWGSLGVIGGHWGSLEVIGGGGVIGGSLGVIGLFRYTPLYDIIKTTTHQEVSTLITISITRKQQNYSIPGTQCISYLYFFHQYHHHVIVKITPL